jgi:hypothetical protein
MKRFVIVFFVLSAVSLAAFALLKLQESDTGVKFAMPRLVPSASGNDASAGTGSMADIEPDIELISLIALQDDETLIQTVSADFNGDGYDDQINAVKRNGRPNIILIVGIYDSRQNTYGRTEEIDTGIAEADSFSYTCTDVTGDHRNALVYSGLASNGDSIMQIILGRGSASALQLTTIGNFRTNGTVTLQQVDRYDTYETLQAAGMSFPVWVYSVDTGVNNTIDQLQTMYEWNPASERYVQSRQTRTVGQALASSELARVQTGTIASFASYVQGTWYQASSDTPDMRYIFFDYDEREILFLYEDMQEVYTWSSSAIRRNGAYLSTVNTGITNLTRQFDVSITGSNEITVRVQDDVHMRINEDSLWNGVYRKLVPAAGIDGNRMQSNVADVIAALIKEPVWRLSDGTQVQFTGSGYEVRSNTVTDSGRFFILYVDKNPVIQFRSGTGQPYFDTAYVMTKNTGTDNKITYLLESVSVLSSGYEKNEKPSIRLESVFTDENAATDN